MKNLMTNFRQEKAFAVRTVESTDEGSGFATATIEMIAGKYAIDVLLLQSKWLLILSEDMNNSCKLQISLGDEEL